MTIVYTLLCGASAGRPWPAGGSAVCPRAPARPARLTRTTFCGLAETMSGKNQLTFVTRARRGISRSAPRRRSNSIPTQTLTEFRKSATLDADSRLDLSRGTPETASRTAPRPLEKVERRVPLLRSLGLGWSLARWLIRVDPHRHQLGADPICRLIILLLALEQALVGAEHVWPPAGRPHHSGGVAFQILPETA